jgi:hypothetical protein
MVPNLLPDLPSLDRLLTNLPLTVRSFLDEKEFYCAVLATPPGFSFGGAPLRIKVRCFHSCFQSAVYVPWASQGPGMLCVCFA